MTTETQAATTQAPATQSTAPVVATAAPQATAPAAQVQVTAAQQAPATEPKAESQQETGAFGEAITYQPTGDSNLDLALGFVGKHGLGPDHPAIVAAGKGDFGPVKALMAEKGIPGWEAHIALAEKGYADHIAQEAEKTLGIKNMCVEVAGSEEQWGEVLEWASANAEPEEKTAVNAALAQGGVVAQAMAAFLVNSFRAAPDTTLEPQATAVKSTAQAGAGASNGPLSPAQYAAEVAKLRSQGMVEGSREYAALQQRRMMYRG